MISDEMLTVVSECGSSLRGHPNDVVAVVAGRADAGAPAGTLCDEHSISSYEKKKSYVGT